MPNDLFRALQDRAKSPELIRWVDGEGRVNNEDGAMKGCWKGVTRGCVDGLLKGYIERVHR